MKCKKCKGEGHMDHITCLDCDGTGLAGADLETHRESWAANNIPGWGMLPH